MKHFLLKFFLFLTVLAHNNVYALSIVYNFRIAQATKQALFDSERETSYTVSTLLFNQYAQQYNKHWQNFTADFESFILTAGHCYLRTDFAFAHIISKIKKLTTFSGTQTDDFLLTVGYNAQPNERISLTESLLFGFPTHHNSTLQHASFGTGQVGIGTQFDGDYKVHSTGDLLFGGKYVYFVSHNACNKLGHTYFFSIGNLIDFLLSYKQNWNKHSLELGTTERIFFGAKSIPKLPTIQEFDYTRTSFYSIYKYKFLIHDVQNRILFNLGYGFDNTKKAHNDKHIVTVWLNWSVTF